MSEVEDGGAWIVVITGGWIWGAGVVEDTVEALLDKLKETASKISPKQRHGSNPGCDEREWFILKWKREIHQIKEKFVI